MGLRDKLKKILFEDNTIESPRADSLKIEEASSSSAKRDPLKVLAKKIGLSLGGDSREFAPPEFDLTQIDKAYDTECYVRQGIDKYIDKMFKAGWSFTGKNPNTVEYIKTRFNYMAEVTQIPTEKLFIEYCEDVVKFSNSVIAKARMKDPAQLPPGVTVQGLNDMEPVVGYFPLNVTTMQVKRDKFGTVKQWQQEVAGQDKPVKFKPQDVIHTYYKRKKGNAFGTPFLLSVIDDVRALRQTEDNVLKMLYRSIYPFYHIAIGSAEFPADDPEIDSATSKVEGMEVDGGLVTSERWKITAVSSDKVIDAEKYLKYFEDRVFSGIGVPGTMYGRGATANKSTSDNMDSEFIDRVKAFHKVTEADINQFMIKELLMEGGFDPVLNPDDMVYFKFNEIDVDMQIKLENHAMYKYEHMAVTEDEMRTMIGLDPITDRSKMYTALVDKEKAQYAEMFKPKTTTGSGEKGNAATNNKVKPKNQHTKKDSVDIDKVTKLYSEHIDELQELVMEYVEEYYNGDKYALTRIKAEMYLKNKIFTDINNINLNSEIVNDVNSAQTTMFLNLTEHIFKVLTNNVVDERIAKEIAIVELSNKFKKVKQSANSALTTKISSKEV